MKLLKFLFIFLGALTRISIATDDTEEYFQEYILKSVTKEEKKCLTTAGELIFILDASTSVGSDNFNKEKEFVIKVIDKLAIGYNLTRVALITYSSFPLMLFNLHQYYTAEEINQQILKAQFTEGIPVVGDALKKVLVEIDPTSRSKVGKVIILISDGKQNGGMDPYTVAQQLKSTNYTILTIGLNKDSDEAALKEISSNNMYYMIKNFDALDRIVSEVVSISCITFHNAKCPTIEIKRETCVDQKQTVYVIVYYNRNGNCIPETRKVVVNCLSPDECPKQYFSVALCSRNVNKTHLLNVTHDKVAGRCFQKVFRLKEVTCGCPQSLQEKTSVILEKDCKNGVKSELILYNEFRESTCQQSFFPLSSVKCEEVCIGNKFVSEPCVNGTRTIKVYIKKFVNNKCDLILEKSSISKCVTECPKSVKITSKRCINETKNLYLVTFQNINMECVQKITKLNAIKCTKGECNKIRLKKSNCIKGKQMVMKVIFTKVGNKCKKNILNVGLVQCLMKDNSNECSKKIKYKMSDCVQGSASIIAKRKVKKDNKCFDESQRIAVVECDGECVKAIRSTLFAGKCENNIKLIFKVTTKLQNEKCYKKIRYLGKIKCKDC